MSLILNVFLIYIQLFFDANYVSYFAYIARTLANLLVKVAVKNNNTGRIKVNKITFSLENKKKRPQKNIVEVWCAMIPMLPSENNLSLTARLYLCKCIVICALTL